MNRRRIFPVVVAACLSLAIAPAAEAQEAEKLDLRKVVSMALVHSRDLALARIQLTVAQNEAGLVRSNFMPNLYTGSGAAYSSGFPQTPTGAAPSVFEMSYTQTVFNLPMRGQLRADQERVREQQVNLDAMRDAVMLQAATKYLELAKARHELELLRSEQMSAQGVTDVTRERAEAGLELDIEVTKQELQSARIAQKILEIEGREEILTAELKDLIGTPLDQAIEVSSEDLATEPSPAAEQAVAQAMAYSPDVKQAELERKAREHLLAGERGGYWPTMDFIGQYSVLSRINNYDQFFKTFQRNNVNVGVQVQIPIYSARTAANVRMARSRLVQAEMELAAKRHDVDLNVRKQIRAARERDAAREVARLELKVTQQSLAMVQAKFDQNRANLRELEQARVEENDKWVAFLDADFAHQQAELELLRMTGQLAKLFQ